MGIGSEGTGKLRQLFQSKGQDLPAPQIPAIPDCADFVVIKGDPADTAKMQLFLDLQTVGTTKAQELEDAYQAREQARKQREAYLRANPPQPEDVVIRVWKRNQPASAQDASRKEVRDDHQSSQNFRPCGIHSDSDGAGSNGTAGTCIEVAADEEPLEFEIEIR